MHGQNHIKFPVHSYWSLNNATREDRVSQIILASGECMPRDAVKWIVCVI